VFVSRGRSDPESGTTGDRMAGDPDLVAPRPEEEEYLLKVAAR